MARKRDVIVGVIIGLVFLGGLAFIGIMFAAVLSEGGQMDFAVAGSGNIGIVEVNGVIDEEMGRKAINQIEHFAESNSVKAIVIHVNSPGGGVAISQEIYDAILRARDEKPVVAAFASVAASGGYYIACAADRIVSNPGSLTGSIGVIFQFHTFYELMDKWGIGTETIKSGELKDVGSYSKEMSQEERLMLRAVVMDSYEQFVAVVADGRGMEKEDIYPLADGSVFTGVQAQNHGLVDTLGGLHEAVGVAAELAGVEGEPRTVRPFERKKFSWWDVVDQAIGDIQPPMIKEIKYPQLMYLFRYDGR